MLNLITTNSAPISPRTQQLHTVANLRVALAFRVVSDRARVRGGQFCGIPLCAAGAAP